MPGPLTGGPIVTPHPTGHQIVPGIVWVTPNNAFPLPTDWFPQQSELGNAGTQEKREFSFAATNQMRSIIYGRNKVGADIFAVTNNSSSGLVMLAAALGEGEIDAVEDTEAYDGTGAPWVTYDHKLGVKTPSADTILQASLNGASETYPFLAWSRLTYNTNILAGGIEFPRFIVRGLKIYDPRENRLTHSEDYSSSYWTFSNMSYAGAVPGLSQNGTTTANDYAGQWAGSSAIASAFRDTSGLGLVASDSITVSIDMRVSSGTQGVTLQATKLTSGSTASVACDLTTAWKRFYVTNSGAGTGEARIKVIVLSAGGTTIEIGRAQIEKNATRFGYKKSVASAVVPVVEYSANPALELADLKTNTRYGQRVGVDNTFTGSGLNDFHVFWDRSGTKGTFDIEIDGTGSPNTFKWRFTPTGGATGSYTTGVAITTNQQLLSNGLYVRFEALTGHTSGNKWSVTTPTTFVDWSTVGLAAEYCDEVMSNGNHRFECHIVLEQKSGFTEWEKTIGSHFAGRWQFSAGTWVMVVHKPTDTVSLAITADHIIANTAKLKRRATLDLPNQLTVSWVDPDDEWKQKRETVIDVQGDVSEIREGSDYPLVGCHTQDQAHRTATYLFNGLLADLEIEFDGLLSLVHLLPGDRVTVQYDPIGLSSPTDFTITSISRSDDLNTVHVTATLYSEDIWSNSVGATDTVGTFVSISPFDTPPEPSRISQPDIAYPTKLMWQAPVVYDADVLYGTGSWSQSGLTGYDGTKVNDGNTSVTAFTADTVTDYLRLDAGSAKRMGSVKIYTSSYASVNALQTQVPRLYYSDDDITYSLQVVTRPTAIVDTTGLILGAELDWDVDTYGSHRYWKLVFTDLFTSQVITEVQFRSVFCSVFPYVKGYEVIIGTATNGQTVLFIPAAAIPTTDNSLDVTNFCQATAESSSFLRYAQNVIVRTVGYNNQRSNGRCKYVQSLVSATDVTQTIPVLRTSTGLGKQSGGLALTGIIESTKGFDIVTAATGTTLESTSVPSGQSVDIKKTLINSVLSSATKKDGSLATLQSSHVAPFLKGRYNCSSTTSITSTTATDITGATTGSFTPATDMRVLVIATWLLSCDTYPAGEFKGLLNMNDGSDHLQTEETHWTATGGGHTTTLIGMWELDLTGGTAYTLKLKGKLASSTGQIDVVQDHTGLTVLALGRL